MLLRQALFINGTPLIWLYGVIENNMSRTMKSRTFVWAAMGLSIAVASSATAGVGDHVRVGAAEVAPSLSMGIGYHTNVFRSEDDEIAGMAVMVSPSVDLLAEGHENTFSAQASYRTLTYTGETSSKASEYSDFDINAVLNAYEHSTVGVSVVDSIGMRNSPVDDLGSTDPFASHFHNRLGVDANIRPGTALEIDVGANWDFDQYYVPEGAQVDGEQTYGSKNTFGPKLDASWSFFPRTAIVVEGEMNFVRWDENVVTAAGDFQLGEFLIIPDSDNWKLKGGIRGRITKPLVLVLMAGYGSALYDEESAGTGSGPISSADKDLAVGYGADLDGWDKLLVDTQLKYNTRAGHKYVLGYKRDFQDVFFTNFVAFDHLYFNAFNRIGGRMGSEFKIGGRYESYAGEVQRTDILLDTKLALSLFLQEWGQLQLGGGWMERASTDNEIEYDDIHFGLNAMFTY